MEKARAEIKEFIGLASRATGEICRLRVEDWGMSQNCSLSRDALLPYFEAKTPRELQRVLLQATPWYNSSTEQPGWGDFQGDDLVPVKVRVSVEVEGFDMPPILRVRTFETRDIHPYVAKNYAGAELATDGDGRIVSWLVYCPDGVTLADMRSWVGKNVYAEQGSSTCRKVYAVCSLPEEIEPLFEGRPGALLLASESRYE